MKKYTIPLLLVFSFNLCKAQDSINCVAKSPYLICGEIYTGLIYCRGIEWTENQKQDSVKEIIITSDTMTVVRNLLVYLLQQKNENDAAGLILSMINLNQLKKIFNDSDFNYFVDDYKKVVTRNKAALTRQFPEYSKHINK